MPGARTHGFWFKSTSQKDVIYSSCTTIILSCTTIICSQTQLSLVIKEQIYFLKFIVIIASCETSTQKVL